LVDFGIAKLKKTNGQVAIRAHSMNGNAYRLIVGKLEGTRPLRRPSYKVVDNIKIV
jgi:hypothetical protein